MIRGQRTEDITHDLPLQRLSQMASRYIRRQMAGLRGTAATTPQPSVLGSQFSVPSPQSSVLSPQSSVLGSQSSERGFTLVEMIMVIVITGILGGIVAVFLKAPIQQYFDVSRRADMTDIADTALRRIGRDVRLALPNSVRVSGSVSGTGSGSCNGSEICYLEFLPTSGGGRYRSGTGGNALNFSVADSSFDVLGGMPASFDFFVAGDLVAVYNLGISGANAYTADNTAAVNVVGSSSTSILLSTAKLFPFESPGARFDIINSPVSYVCNPAAGNLTRVSGYAIAATQPTGALPAGTLLAKSVSSCSFSYEATVVAQRAGLLTMSLSITQPNPGSGDETITLYSATHVNNLP